MELSWLEVLERRTVTEVRTEPAPVSRGHWFKLRLSPEMFRLLYAIAKIAFTTARIIASLDVSCYLAFVRMLSPFGKELVRMGGESSLTAFSRTGRRVGDMVSDR